MHHCQLTRVIELQAGNPLAAGQDRRFGRFPQWPTVKEGFQDVRLDVMVLVDDLRHPLAKPRKLLDALVDTIVVDTVGSRLGSQPSVVTHVRFGKAVPVATVDHRMGQVQIFDHGLQLALVQFGHSASEDRRDLVGLSDVAIQVP